MRIADNRGPNYNKVQLATLAEVLLKDPLAFLASHVAAVQCER